MRVGPICSWFGALSANIPISDWYIEKWRIKSVSLRAQADCDLLCGRWSEECFAVIEQDGYLLVVQWRRLPIEILRSQIVTLKNGLSWIGEGPLGDTGGAVGRARASLT